MQYKEGDYINFLQEENKISRGTLIRSPEAILFAEDESGYVNAMTGPEYVDVKTESGQTISIKSASILTPAEVIRLKSKGLSDKIK